MCEEIDIVRLNFSEGSLLILDATLFIIMYGVALNLKWQDFQAVIQRPRSPLLGLFSQFLVLPALTLGLVYVVEPCPSIALGMFLVAACPGGNISNFMSLMAKANVALSVSLSAVSTMLAIFMTPLNFAFWSGLYPPAQAIMEEINMDPVAIFVKILMILAIPLALGMWTTYRFPDFSARIAKPLNKLSIVIFGGYVVAALASNFDFFLRYVQFVILIVAAHNAIALLSGYTVASLGRLPVRDRRTLAIETGIQNSGVALVLIFGPLFEGLGGMAMIAALWGIWHIVAGLSLSTIWSRMPVKEKVAASEM
ncbi:MAG: bile acid:sodium symporter family protein [Bacteroidota bacterium]